MDDFSFQKGFSQVQQKDITNVRCKIMTALNINTRPAWYSRLYGNVEPKVTEHRAIEEIFASHGITEVWGALEQEKVEKE